jgi:integrase
MPAEYYPKIIQEAFMAVIKDYADLFAPDGYWRKKRAEKRIYFTDKSLKTRQGILTNYIVPLWGKYHPKKLTVRIIDTPMMGITSEFTSKQLAGATRNRILSVLSELYFHLIEKGVVKTNSVVNVVRCRSRPEYPRGALSLEIIKKLFSESHEALKKIWYSQKYICAFLILKDTGLRPGELVALKWSDWRVDLRFFPIIRAIESGTKDQEKETKTGNCHGTNRRGA